MAELRPQSPTSPLLPHANSLYVKIPPGGRKWSTSLSLWFEMNQTLLAECCIMRRWCLGGSLSCTVSNHWLPPGFSLRCFATTNERQLPNKPKEIRSCVLELLHHSLPKTLALIILAVFCWGKLTLCEAIVRAHLWAALGTAQVHYGGGCWASCSPPPLVFPLVWSSKY